MQAWVAPLSAVFNLALLGAQCPLQLISFPSFGRQPLLLLCQLLLQVLGSYVCLLGFSFCRSLRPDSPTSPLQSHAASFGRKLKEHLDPQSHSLPKCMRLSMDVCEMIVNEKPACPVRDDAFDVEGSGNCLHAARCGERTNVCFY